MHPTSRIGMVGITAALSAALATPEVQAALAKGSYELTPREAASAADRAALGNRSRQHQANAWDNRHAHRKGTSLLDKARRAKGRI